MEEALLELLILVVVGRESGNVASVILSVPGRLRRINWLSSLEMREEQERRTDSAMVRSCLRSLPIMGSSVRRRVGLRSSRRSSHSSSGQSYISTCRIEGYCVRAYRCTYCACACYRGRRSGQRAAAKRQPCRLRRVEREPSEDRRYGAKKGGKSLRPCPSPGTQSSNSG